MTVYILQTNKLRKYCFYRPLQNVFLNPSLCGKSLAHKVQYWNRLCRQTEFEAKAFLCLFNLIWQNEIPRKILYLGFSHGKEEDWKGQKFPYKPHVKSFSHDTSLPAHSSTPSEKLSLNKWWQIGFKFVAHLCTKLSFSFMK